MSAARKRTLVRDWVKRRYKVFRRNYAENLSELEKLADDNSLLYIEGPAGFRATDADTLRLDGGSLYLSLPSSERPFTVVLPGGARVEATRVVFEYRDGELRVKDGMLRLQRGSAPPLDLAVGQAVSASLPEARTFPFAPSVASRAIRAGSAPPRSSRCFPATPSAR